MGTSCGMFCDANLQLSREVRDETTQIWLRQKGIVVEIKEAYIIKERLIKEVVKTEEGELLKFQTKRRNEKDACSSTLSYMLFFNFCFRQIKTKS